MNGVGIDELFRRIDPYDVSVMIGLYYFSNVCVSILKEKVGISLTTFVISVLQYQSYLVVFKNWPIWYHGVSLHCYIIKHALSSKFKQ